MLNNFSLFILHSTSGRMSILYFETLDQAEDALTSLTNTQPTLTVSRLYVVPGATG